MNKTTNYELNQWETTDRILMKDFNDDNAAIDAALKENADEIAAEAAARQAATANVAKFVKLKEIAVAQGAVDVGGTYTLEIDVSDIDFPDWQFVYLDIFPKGGGQAKLRINDRVNSCQYVYPANGNGYGGNGALLLIPMNASGTFADRITFHVGRQGQRKVMCTAGHITGHCTDVTFAELTKLKFIGEMQADSRFIFWGEA